MLQEKPQSNRHIRAVRSEPHLLAIIIIMNGFYII